MLTIGVILVFPFVFVAIWSAVCSLLGAFSGWMGLSSTYATTREEPRGAVHGAFARIGFVSYRGVLTVGADEEGLYLAVMSLFRPGHHPLHLPWSAVAWEGEQSFLGFGTVHLRLGGRVGLHLGAASWYELDPALRARVPGAS